MTETLYLPTARYTWGGDEFLFVEFDEAMNLTANYLATTVAQGGGANVFTYQTGRSYQLTVKAVF